jgi:hypothetical protein
LLGSELRDSAGGRTHRKIIATTPKLLGLEVHIPAGVSVIIPNVTNHPPGTRLRYRSCDAQTFGWYTLNELTASPVSAAPRTRLR